MLRLQRYFNWEVNVCRPAAVRERLEANLQNVRLFASGRSGVQLCVEFVAVEQRTCERIQRSRSADAQHNFRQAWIPSVAV